MKKCLIVLPILFLFGCFNSSEVIYQKGFTSYPTNYSKLPYYSERPKKDQRTFGRFVSGTSTTQYTPRYRALGKSIDLGTYDYTPTTQHTPIVTKKVNSE
jgi:hypothetical protein